MKASATALGSSAPAGVEKTPASIKEASKEPIALREQALGDTPLVEGVTSAILMNARDGLIRGEDFQRSGYNDHRDGATSFLEPISSC
uniref:Uncharacterized protein n=1 Tax=Cannabis sativa TaxID=3483 RepID=A0A803P0V6_CANSA